MYLKTPSGQCFQIKGPKVEGSLKDGIHIGPINIPLPHVGTLDIWAKLEGSNLAITIKIEFFGKVDWKRFTLPLPLATAPKAITSSYD